MTFQASDSPRIFTLKDIVLILCTFFAYQIVFIWLIWHNAFYFSFLEHVGLY